MLPDVNCDSEAMRTLDAKVVLFMKIQKLSGTFLFIFFFMAMNQ